MSLENKVTSFLICYECLIRKLSENCLFFSAVSFNTTIGINLIIRLLKDCRIFRISSAKLRCFAIIKQLLWLQSVTWLFIGGSMLQYNTF